VLVVQMEAAIKVSLALDSKANTIWIMEVLCTVTVTAVDWGGGMGHGHGKSRRQEQEASPARQRRSLCASGPPLQAARPRPAPESEFSIPAPICRRGQVLPVHRMGQEKLARCTEREQPAQSRLRDVLPDHQRRCRAECGLPVQRRGALDCHNGLGRAASCRSHVYVPIQPANRDTETRDGVFRIKLKPAA
jgi:hypothetical protein